MKKIIKIMSVLLVCMLLATSCGDFYDVNTDPNNAASSTIDLVFPGGVASVAFVVGGNWLILGSFWSEHWTQSTGAGQYIAVDTYNMNDASSTNAYTTMYSGGLVNLDFVSKKAAETESWNYFLMSEVMTAYTFQVLVDLYDKVPYSEALKGAANATPKFDNGQDIYDDLIVRIDAALAKDRTLASAALPGTDDLVFHGDMDNWVRFANTVKLKLYMRQTEMRPSVAQAGITALFNSGAEFLEEIPAEMTAFIDVTNFRNPYFATEVSTGTGGKGNVNVAASQTLFNYLQENTDPRLDALFNPPVNGGPQVALEQGDYTNTGYVNSKDLSQPNIGPNHPAVFMSVAESFFLQAEAIQRYGVTDNVHARSAKDLYELGIQSSFDKLDVGDASGYYGAGDPYEYDNTIESIIVQKWISMANYEGLESYFEHLRTGYPSFFVVTPQNVTGGLLPSRLPYPSTELNNNGAKLAEAGGQRRVVEHVWWDPS